MPAKACMPCCTHHHAAARLAPGCFAVLEPVKGKWAINCLRAEEGEGAVLTAVTCVAWCGLLSKAGVLSMCACLASLFDRARLPVTTLRADGQKRIHLSGKWNSHCDMVKCDFEGKPLPDMEPQR